MTPAQASGRYDFVEDVPVQGPTDPGIRAADCWWTQNVLPVKKPACVDCNGPIPKWANRPTAWGGGAPEYGGNGGSNCAAGPVRYGSRNVAGFALDAPRGWSVAEYQDGGSLAANEPPRGWSVAEYQDGGSLAANGDPAATLTSDQQVWVQSTLNTLNRKINETTGTYCSQDAGTSLAAAVACFQGWANANSKGSLRTDGVLDQDTLTALQAVAAAHPADFQTPFPAASAVPLATPAAPAAAIPEPPPVTSTAVTPLPPEKKKGLSTPVMVAIGVGAAVVAGGVVYAVTSKGGKSPAPTASERRRRRR